MEKAKQVEEVMWEIKKDFPEVDREKILYYSKNIIYNLYNELKNEEDLKNKYNKTVVDKILNNKLKYKISKDIDHISIQYAELYNYEKKEDKKFITVYLSIYFYDNTANNLDNQHIEEKYWNDIWFVTFVIDEGNFKEKNNCINCGGIMKYNETKNMFICEYCGNEVNNNIILNLQVVDINVKKE